MSSQLQPGNNIPHDIHVIIEVPAHSDPVKYEVDKKTGLLFVDRFMMTAMHYPCDYGYIPQTLGEDGDPLDVLVVSPFSLISGSVIQVRAVGALKMTDESGPDTKILTVPIPKLTSLYDHVQTIEDLPPLLLKQISHFFEHYKDLEEGKWVKVDGWLNLEETHAIILDGIERSKK
ncbi:MAG: inorganic diphosphatase [Gammaproteobacteria bacterium]